MIVVDSSALIAVLFEEPEKQAFQDIIDGDERCVLSAVNAHETACVLRGRLGVVAVAEFWQWLADNEVEIVPFDEVQVRRRRRLRPLRQGHRPNGEAQSR
jgi:ribonuclease VapC